MGYQIIKQPNGLYGIWSSVVDHFIMYDCTPEDIIEEWVDDARKRITQGVQETVAELDAGEKPYYQFTMTWDEAIQFARKVHGKNDATLKELAEAGLA